MIAWMEGFNYHHLHYFWVVAREGSIARASKLLMLAQPTISAQIHELEESLGRKLFARAGRGLALTETGQTVYGYAEQIFRLGSEMIDAAHGQPAPKPVQFRAGVDSTISKLIAARILKPALRVGKRVRSMAAPAKGAWPARIVVREDTLEHLVAQLALGTLDLVLSDSPASPSRIKVHAHLLGESSLSLFARASEAPALKRHFPHSLDGAPMLLPRADSNLRRTIDRWLEAESLRPRHRWRVRWFNPDEIVRANRVRNFSRSVAPGARVAEAIWRRHNRPSSGYQVSVLRFLGRANPPASNCDCSPSGCPRRARPLRRCGIAARLARACPYAKTLAQRIGSPL